MRVKKNAVYVLGGLVIVNIVCLIFFQFRLYNVIGLCEGENQFSEDMREFLIIITGGLFTGACVTFLISIQEYLAEKRTALRNLYRLSGLIKEKFQRVRFFVPKIPEKIASDYFISNYMYDKYFRREDIGWTFGSQENEEARYSGTSFPEEKKKFRDRVWENQSDLVKELYNTDEKRERYLDKKCIEAEKEYMQHTEEFIASLQVFNDFNVYEIQEAFDRISFFTHKNKVVLQHVLLGLVPMIRLIQYYITLTNVKENAYENSLYALDAVNHCLLKYDEAKDTAYIIPLYYIDQVQCLVSDMLNSGKRNLKELNIEKYAVSKYLNMDFAEDILWDALDRK